MEILGAGDGLVVVARDRGELLELLREHVRVVERVVAGRAAGAGRGRDQRLDIAQPGADEALSWNRKAIRGNENPVHDCVQRRPPQNHDEP